MILQANTVPELINAIIQANQTAGSHTINLVTTRYTLTSVQDTSNGPSGLPAITGNITINGGGATLERSSASVFRILYIAPGGVLNLNGVFVQNGLVDGTDSGGGIYNSGTLNVNGCRFQYNGTFHTFDYTEAMGGAIGNAPGAQLTVENTTLNNNFSGQGGAIANDGTATLNNCVIINNFTLSAFTGSSSGGGVYNGPSASSLTVINCIIAQNQAQNGGGLYIYEGTVSILDSYIYDNQVWDTGAALFVIDLIGSSSTVTMTNTRIVSNRSTSGSTWYAVQNGPSRTLLMAPSNWWGASNGPSGPYGGSGDSASPNTSVSPVLPTDEVIQDGGGTCQIGFSANDIQTTGNPISLRLGEKRVDETDLVVQTAAGPLDFRRNYRQGKQSQFQFMGLGWTHSQVIVLTLTGVSPARTATVQMNDGSLLFLDEVASPSGHFDAQKGSNAVLDYKSATNEYVLTGQDKSLFTFDGTSLRLKTLMWPNNEVWTYSYYGPADGVDLDGKLKRVDDGYGRAIQLTYIRDTDPNTYKRRQLWRAGDHTATNLDTASPSGRYIELDYVPEKINGSPIASPKALLSSVRDVRGNTWIYDYYGQNAGETVTDLLNKMIQRTSPSVDITGDGTADGALTLEKLTYQANVQLDVAVNGTMELDSDWFNIPALSPATNERSSTQKDSGLYARHVVGDINTGIQGNVWNLVANKSYTVTARVYPVSGGVKMKVSGTSAFDRTSSGTGSWQTLTATVTPTTSIPNCRLQFMATVSPSEFYVDNVTIVETNPDYAGLLQERGGIGANALQATSLVFAPHQKLTRETQVNLSTLHRFDQGLYLGSTDPKGNSAQQLSNPRFRPTTQVDANGNRLALNWSSSGKLLQQVVDAAGNKTAFDYNLTGLSADALNYSLDAQGRKTQYTYADSSNPRLPTRIKVLDTDGTTVLSWKEFTYDSKGRTLTEKVFDPANGTTLLQQTTRAYGSSGNENGLLLSLTQVDVPSGANNIATTYSYDSAGRVVKTQQSSLFGSCKLSYTVYDPAGNVLATVCVNPDDTTTSIPATVADALAIYNAADPIKKKNVVTTYEYDTLGRRVKTTANDGASNPDKQISLTFYDALGRVIRTIANYANQSGGAAESPGLWVWSTANNRWEKSSSNTTAITFGSDNNQNIISDTAYNIRGMVKSQRDALGNLTLLGYDDVGRLVKTIQSASQPAYNNDYNGTSPDPALGSYSPNGAADKDIITSQNYDPAGNLVKTVDPLGVVNYTVYDALNRAVKTVQAAKDTATISLNAGDVGYDATLDPRSDSYVFSTAPDRDITQTTEYDSLGRVIRTKRLLDNRPNLIWDVTLYGYDALGRQVRVIQSASNPAYVISADPSLAAYTISADRDKDVVTKTAYDTNGRVLYTEDTLGSRTWMGYDGLGRQVKTVVNAVGTATDGGVNDPRSSSYVPSSSADQDLVSTTTYNADGQVQSTQDALGRVARNVYDARGRVVRTIANYVAQGATDPKDWVWSTSNNRWEYGAANTTAISHGTDNDQNIISDTVYDVLGRVVQTIDNRFNTTQMVFDGVGRRLKTISTYVVQGSSNPANWLWSTVNNRWEDGAGTAISFGTDKDQNRISLTTYDVAGRVTRTRDAAGMETRFSFDALGRRTQTIANYVDGTFSSAAPDEDLISTITYNKAGQVIATTDARGTQTAFAYDKAGRRVQVTSAANNPLSTLTYTCFDKAGRVLRTIQNWSNNPNKPPPDSKDANGNWLFVPDNNGAYNDRDLITDYLLDNRGRTVQVLDPAGSQILTGYDKDGQTRWVIDPEYSVSHYRYDKLRRRTRVVQGYQPVPVNQKIVFDSFLTGTYDVYTMNVDGSGQVDITNATGQDHNADYTPDGSKIVFASDRAGVTPTFYYDVYVMNADGSNIQRLTDLSGYAAEPSWSPDGGQITFSFKATTYYSLYVMNADGSNLRVVYSNSGLSAGQPKWSPDGQRLIFYASTDNFATIDIYSIRLDGTQLANLTNNGAARNSHPAWAWDGSKIAFSSVRNSNQDVYVMNADGSNPVNLSQNAADDRRPNWSPDGSKLVFSSTRDTPNLEVYVMNADGSGQTRLTTNTLYNQYPNWTKTVIDPASWMWSIANNRWEDGSGNLLPHGADNDRNIIVDVTYDKGGRVLTQREPRGNGTTYVYDLMNRRKSLTNPLSKVWSTAYSDLTGGKSRVTMTYPGITGSANYPVSRDFDRLGRLQNIQFGAPAVTPDVVMTYDDAGNRAKMSEYAGAGFTSRKRETQLTYDKAHRLKQAAFDTDGNGTVDESVSYEYDAGGLRTKLTLPGSLNVVYTYDQRGQLLSLTDWDSQKTQFAYDNVGRHIATERANGLRSRYQFDPAGRLKVLRHSKDFRTLAHFEYQVDKRGNRIQALEVLANPTTATNTTIASTDKGLALTGTWSDVGGYKESTQSGAQLKLLFFGDQATLSMGQGPDHSIYDVYINNTLWQSFDGYAAVAAQRDIVVTAGVDSRKLQGEGPHLLEIRNRAEKNKTSTGNKLRFKQLAVTARTWTQQTIGYSYDKLSRLKEARYNPGVNGTAVDADLLRRYLYVFDRAGNRTQQSVAVNGGASTITNYTYNAANQLTADGTNTFGYDNNGNLTTANSVQVSTWDRANRLLSTFDGVTTVQHVYDGEGHRVQQTVSSTITKYLLDIQPGLAVVLSETTGANTMRYVHGPRGIHAHKDASNNWEWTVQDGLGSVREVVDNAVGVLESRNYDPYGNAFGATGTSQTGYGFAGELVDGSGMLDLRARRYNAVLGVFASLDPFEGRTCTPMSLNGYSWVEGNVPNSTDPSGKCSDPASNCSAILAKWLMSNNAAEKMRLYAEYLRCMGGPQPTPVPPTPTPVPPTPTPVPPTPTPVPTRFIFLGGSNTDKGINAPTDIQFSTWQAPVWANKAYHIVPYTGTKLSQAEQALSEVSLSDKLIVVGYSAGADAALIFSDKYLTQQQNLSSEYLVGLAILGPTLDGSVGMGENLRTTDINGIPKWQVMLNRVVANGTRVLVVDDEYEPQYQSAKPDWASYSNTNTNYCYVRRSDRKHFVLPTSSSEIGTNTDDLLANSVLDFLRGNSSCPPSS